ncbi:hypothetical protein K1719_025742 [Acacia pycnantha]|nr:hypothetical protein K1719_025742 [Acacia pycnantha]
MEKNASSSPTRGTASEGGCLSCWRCLKVKLPWGKRASTYRPIGGFNYDPLSYAQNFDDGLVYDDEAYTRRGFSARYAAPSSTTHNKSSPVYK